MTMPFMYRKSRTYTEWLKVLIFIPVVAAAITSCVMIPYEPDSEVSLSNADHLISSEMMVTVGPRALLTQVSEAIESSETRIKIADPVAFRDAAYPDGDWRIERLFEKGNCIRAARDSNVQYLVLVGQVKDILLEESGGIDIWVGFYGAGSAKGETRLSAVIVDLIKEHPMHEVHASSIGTFSGVGLFYGLFIIPQTEESAIKGLGREIAKTIINSTTKENIRVAVLALEPLEEEYASRLEHEQYLEDLRKRADQGESNAQWELYHELPKEENLVWLCRAADQGQTNARRELGKLYFYGSSNYRRFDNIQIPSDISKSCMWSNLAGHLQITEQPTKKVVKPSPIKYESPEVERTAKVMTEQELETAEDLILAWEPGQCANDLSRDIGREYENYYELIGLCMEADQGSFAARDTLGQMYFLGLSGVEPDNTRAYMWYRLAANVYKSYGMETGITQSMCDTMTPEQRSIVIKQLKAWKPGTCERDLLQYQD